MTDTDTKPNTAQLVFKHWTTAQLDEARRIAVEVVQRYGDLVGDEYERFLKNPWNDHCAVQSALRAMPRADAASSRMTRKSKHRQVVSIATIKQSGRLFELLPQRCEATVEKKWYSESHTCPRLAKYQTDTGIALCLVHAEIWAIEHS